MTLPSPNAPARGASSARAPQPADQLGSVGFIGAGAVGGALARALAARGVRVVAVTSSHPPSAADVAASIPGCQALPDAAAVVAASDTVVLAAPDDAIVALDASLPWRPAQTALHLSGARGIDALPHAATAGAAVAALHPLMLFPRPPLDAASALARLAGCTWALAASDATTAARLEQVVAALDGHVVRLAEQDRVPYHIAAVFASNYVVALLGSAVDIWERFGVAPQVALDALLPLLRATVENLAALGPVRALTGPIARGDASTIAAHLAWLAAPAATPATPATMPADAAVRAADASAATPATASNPDLHAAYIALARLAIPLALARGTLSEPAAQALRALLGGQEE